MSKVSRHTPLEAIRLFCVECMGGSFQGVSECNDRACPFHDYRHGKSLMAGLLAPVRACRKYCLEYCLPEGGPDGVKDCGGDTALLGPCPVFPFRMGKNPNRQKPLSPERRAALVEGGKRYHFTPGDRPLSGPSESTETRQADL